MYATAIRRSWWLILLAIIICAALGYAKSAASPNIYQASVGFYISTPDINSQNAFNSDQFAQGRANSYAELLSGTAFASYILPDLKHNYPPAQTGDLSAEDLSHQISGSASINTVTLVATVNDTSASGALTIAQAIADKFPEYVVATDTFTKSYQIKPVVYTGPTVLPAPVSPRTKLNIAVFALAGLLLGLILSVIRFLTDISIRSPESATSSVGAPLIGRLSKYTEAQRHPLATSELGTPRAEELRQLRTNIRFISAARAVKSLVVTSPSPSEGKTTIATNLGVISAESGARVLLIEADMRRPKMAFYLGIDGTVGLSDVLTDEIAFVDAVQEWGDSGPAFLAAGSTPPNPAELLGSDRMKQLMRKLVDDYDLILLDAPPLLPVTDAAVLSEITDGALVVLRYGKTRQAHASTAAESLEKVGARIIGCVLNMCPPKSTGINDYSYYSSSDPHSSRDSKRFWNVTRRKQSRSQAPAEPSRAAR